MALRGLGFMHGTQNATLTGNKLQEALVKVAEKYVADEEKRVIEQPSFLRCILSRSLVSSFL